MWWLLHIWKKSQFRLKILTRERIMTCLMLPLSYCPGAGGFQVNNMVLLKTKHTLSFTVEKLLFNLKKFGVFFSCSALCSYERIEGEAI